MAVSSVVHSSLLSVFPIGPQGTTCFKPLLQISKMVRTAVEVVHEDAVPLVSEPVIVKVIQHQPMSQTKVRSRYVIFLSCVQLPVPYIPICSISQYPCFYLPLLWLLGHVLQKASRSLNHINQQLTGSLLAFSRTESSSQLHWAKGERWQFIIPKFSPWWLLPQIIQVKKLEQQLKVTNGHDAPEVVLVRPAGTPITPTYLGI